MNNDSNPTVVSIQNEKKTQSKEKVEKNGINEDDTIKVHIEKIQQLKMSINEIILSSQTLRHCLTELSECRTDKEQTKVIKNIQEIISKTNDNAARCRFQLQSLSLEIKKLKRNNTGGTIFNLYKHNYSSLSHLFMTTIRDYQHIQQIFRNILEKNMQTELTVLETYTQIPIDSETLSNPQMLQTIAKTTNHEIRETYLAVQDKYRDILSIRNSMKEIHQLFFDLSLLLEEQGTQLDMIEVNVFLTVIKKDMVGGSNQGPCSTSRS